MLLKRVSNICREGGKCLLARIEINWVLWRVLFRNINVWILYDDVSASVSTLKIVIKILIAISTFVLLQFYETIFVAILIKNYYFTANKSWTDCKILLNFLNMKFLLKLWKKILLAIFGHFKKTWNNKKLSTILHDNVP